MYVYITIYLFILFEYNFLFYSSLYLGISNWLINPLKGFFGSEGHVALDINPGPGYDTLLM